jgi:hypothetical protein
MNVRIVSVSLAIAALCGACGGDDAPDEASSSSIASPSSAGNAPAGQLFCAKETCKLPESLSGETLCCMDPFSGGCGIKAADSCRPFPKVDERCPVGDLGLAMGPDVVPLFGCCTSDDQCGFDFMGSCQPRSVACNFVSKDMVEMIQPQTCDGKALALPDVCGF